MRTELPRMSGAAFALIREYAGYKRAAFQRYLAQKKREGDDPQQIGSYSGLVQMEQRAEVPGRYVQLLRLFLGTNLFYSLVDQLRQEMPAEFFEEVL